MLPSVLSKDQFSLPYLCVPNVNLCGDTNTSAGPISEILGFSELASGDTRFFKNQNPSLAKGKVVRVHSLLMSPYVFIMGLFSFCPTGILNPFEVWRSSAQKHSE